MLEIGMPRRRPELKSLVAEASRSLARLDADRLEELVRSCQALNRDLAPVSREERESLARQAREAAGDMAVFARVLQVTRANLGVMNRLRQLRHDRLEYTPRQAQGTLEAEVPKLETSAQVSFDKAISDTENLNPEELDGNH